MSEQSKQAFAALLRHGNKQIDTEALALHDAMTADLAAANQRIQSLEAALICIVEWPLRELINESQQIAQAALPPDDTMNLSKDHSADGGDERC